MYTFKQVGLEAANELSDLWAETFTQAYQDVHTPENIRAYCTQNYSVEEATAVLTNKQYNCILAYRDPIPVGYYILKHEPCPIPLDGDSSELKQIYILASEYGTGLGRKLFAHAVNLAQQARYRWLWLCVSDINYRAQKFYQKLNFEPIAPGPTLVVGTDHLSSTIMALPIGEL